MSALRSELEVPGKKISYDTVRVLHGLPPYAAAPSKSAAFTRSALSSRSFANLALSAGLSTASESYSESSPAAFLAAFCASFSASFALSVPFFFGGATVGFASSSSEESSQSD